VDVFLGHSVCQCAPSYYSDMLLYTESHQMTANCHFANVYTLHLSYFILNFLLTADFHL